MDFRLEGISYNKLMIYGLVSIILGLLIELYGVYSLNARLVYISFVIGAFGVWVHVQGMRKQIVKSGSKL